MTLTKLCDRIYITDFEPERDRPALALVVGDGLTAAIDAGHSPEHVEEFYRLITQNGLPLPDVTIITHWHWDHTFGICAAHGLVIAESRTQQKLQQVMDNWAEKGEAYYKRDVHVALEYKDQTMNVVGADIAFKDELQLDLKGVSLKAFHIPSPHTDDAAFILVPEQKVLFVGDGICGEYPTWEMDPQKLDKLVQDLQQLDFDTAVGGHWEPFTKQGLISALRNGELG